MTQVNHTDRSHARLSPSSAKRWMLCPGSPDLVATVPPITSESAALGTRAHEWGEHLLRVRLEGAVTTEESPKPDDDFMESQVKIYADYCEALARESDEYFIEERLSLEQMHKDIYGTGDFGALIIRDKMLHSVDLKYGVTIVDPYMNPQLFIYGLGTVAKLYHRIKSAGIKMSELTVRCTIVQPRGEHPDGPIRHFDIMLNELIWWANSRMLPAAHMTDRPDAPCVAGPHCDETFCPAMQCAARHEYHNAMVTAEFGGMARTVDMMSWDTERLGRIVRFWLNLGDLKDKVMTFAYAVMMQGVDIPGLKLVPKKAHRRWRNEGKAEAALVQILKSQAYERKLLTPAKAEQKLKAAGVSNYKEIVAEYSEKPDAGMTVALESDPRQAQLPPGSVDRYFQ